LVVIAIIAVLIGLLLPAVQKVRSAAQRAQCQSNMKQIALACHNYESTYGYLPPTQHTTVINGATLSSGATLQALILPYVEQANKYNLFDFNYNVNSDTPIDPSIPAKANANNAARLTDVPFYLCPSDPSDANYFGAGRLNYFGSIGAQSNYRGSDPSKDGIFAIAYPANGKTMKGIPILQISDGTSNTAMFAETLRGTFISSATGSYDNTTSMIRSAVFTGNELTDGRIVPECNPGAYNLVSSVIRYVGHQYYRNLPQDFLYTHTLPINWNKLGSQNYPCGTSGFNVHHMPASSYHTGGANVCMGDGSVRFVSESINFDTWRAMGTRAGGESVSDN
jgi:prepilin-type processing-associated H-X9-DG protein